MSQFDSILGLHGLTIMRVERHADIHVWAEPKGRPACIHCDHPSVRIKATHRRTVKHTRLGTQLLMLHLRVPSITARSATGTSATASRAYGPAIEPPSRIGWRCTRRTKAASLRSV